MKCVFIPEDGGSKILRNVGILTQYYTSGLRKPGLECSQPWKPQITQIKVVRIAQNAELLSTGRSILIKVSGVLTSWIIRCTKYSRITLLHLGVSQSAGTADDNLTRRDFKFPGIGKSQYLNFRRQFEKTFSRITSVGRDQRYLRTINLTFSEVQSRQGLGFFLTTASRPPLRSTQPPILWVPGGFSLGVKRPGRESDHSHRVPRSILRAATPSFPNTPSCRGAPLKHRES